MYELRKLKGIVIDSRRNRHCRMRKCTFPVFETVVPNFNGSVNNKAKIHCLINKHINEKFIPLSPRI